MSNLRAGYLNAADSATITCTTLTGGAAAYLTNDSRGDTLTLPAGTNDIFLTWGGSTKTLMELCLHRITGLAYNDTIAETYYPNSDFTGVALYNPGATAAYTSGLFDDWDFQFVNRYHSTITLVKSVRIRIVNAGVITISRLFLGPYTEAPYNPAYGADFGWDNDESARWRMGSFEMMVETEAHRAAWSEIARYMGGMKSAGRSHGGSLRSRRAKSAVFSLFPGNGGTEERDHTVYAKFERSPVAKIADFARYDMRAQILET